MRIIVLGSGAGGGFPQWNCNCPNCRGLREGRIRATPRTQSSLAISDGGENWLLVNASPDLRAQIASCPPLQPGRAVRDTAIAAVLLVDAQIDHATGLMTLREHRARLQVHCTPSVHADLTTGYPLLRVLESYCGIDWHPVDAVAEKPFVVDGLPGLTFVDRASGRRCFYAPGLAAFTDRIRDEARQADCVLLDGTLWKDDELKMRGASQKTGREMGHLAQTGRGGMVEELAALPGRKVLIHINNTNPILDEDSPERKRLDALGIEVAYDGMEISL